MISKSPFVGKRKIKLYFVTILVDYTCNLLYLVSDEYCVTQNDLFGDIKQNNQMHTCLSLLVLSLIQEKVG